MYNNLKTLDKRILLIATLILAVMMIMSAFSDTHEAMQVIEFAVIAVVLYTCSDNIVESVKQILKNHQKPVYIN